MYELFIFIHYTQTKTTQPTPNPTVHIYVPNSPGFSLESHQRKICLWSTHKSLRPAFSRLSLKSVKRERPFTHLIVRVMPTKQV